jgi:tryptophan synthase alpha chain
VGRVREALEPHEGKKGLIPYIVGGYPSLEESMNVLLALQEAGATAIEVGIPFSDPMADGPVIQRAHAEALEAGVTPGAILDALRGLGGSLRAPVLFMTYYNPVYRMGVGAFALAAREAGVSGAIIPDLPPEAGGEWINSARREGLDTVFLVAPNTPRSRMREIASVTSGFIYYLSLAGVTGSTISSLEKVREKVALVKEEVGIPVCVGFGVSSSSEAKALADSADGVIVGSALLKIMEKEGSGEMLDFFTLLRSSV